jgi:hypothetical protein
MVVNTISTIELFVTVILLSFFVSKLMFDVHVDHDYQYLRVLFVRVRDLYLSKSSFILTRMDGRRSGQVSIPYYMT